MFLKSITLTFEFKSQEGVANLNLFIQACDGVLHQYQEGPAPIELVIGSHRRPIQA